MKKTIIALALCATMSGAAYADSDLLSATPYYDGTPCIAENSVWSTDLDSTHLAAMTTQGDTTYNVYLGNPNSWVSSIKLTTTTDIYVNKIDGDGFGLNSLTAITLDLSEGGLHVANEVVFNKNGKINSVTINFGQNQNALTAGQQINFTENIKTGAGCVTLSAELTDIETAALSAAEGATISRVLMTAGSKGFWNLSDAATRNMLVEGYINAGYVESIEKLANGAAGFMIEGNEVKLVVKSIPEPATATLSLLALAGLAARRRRH